MRWWVVVGLLVLAGGIVLYRVGWWGAVETARPLPVPDGDHEVAFLHISTAGDTWENFVWGVKRAEMTAPGAPTGLRVDDSAAFPDRTTAVPEVVISRDGFDGKVRIRWYKVTNDASTDAWVKALAARSQTPLAIIGGWSSDRARGLADAMTAATWPGQKPLLLLATATAETVYGDDYKPLKLIGLYDRSFRLCFTNRQMARAVTDFVFTDPSLRPGPAVLPGLRAVPGAAGGPWAMFPWLAELQAGPTGVPTLPDAKSPKADWPAFAFTWEDDPYSGDLYDQFSDAINEQGTQRTGRPWLEISRNKVPFSAGRFSRSNPYESHCVDEILKTLPRRGDRTLLIIPTVTAPARRVLSALAQGSPGAARRLVAVTGDGIPVNAIFRDGEFAWPVRAIPIPLVLCTHTDPFDWDEPGDPNPPRGYELQPPVKAGDVKSSTEDIQLFSTMARVLARGAFADGATRVTDGADVLVARFREPGLFDEHGDRKSGSGEHVVVLRPTPRVEGTVTYPDAVIEVWTRPDGTTWNRIRSRPVVQTVRPYDIAE